nr:MAG TPA: hypothetical protein [Caudoviricetes sp.]
MSTIDLCCRLYIKLINKNSLSTIFCQKLSQKFFSTLSKKSENDNFGQHF